MKCVALVVLMALAAANATLYAPSYLYAPSLGVRALPGAAISYAYPRAYYQAAAPQYVLSAPALRLAAPAPAIQLAAPALRLAAPAPAVQIVAQPAVDIAVPNAAVYRASNPGATHEALLPGHSLSVLSENLELAPGTIPAASAPAAAPAAE